MLTTSKPPPRRADGGQDAEPEPEPRDQAISKPTAGTLFGTWGPGQHPMWTQHMEPNTARGSLTDTLGCGTQADPRLDREPSGAQN